MITPSKGVRLAVDVGSVRIGVARCDQDQIMAMPVATVNAGSKAITQVIDLIQEFNAEVIYVGKPISLSTNETESTKLAIDFASKLAAVVNFPVRLLDERLTTVSAQTQLHASGKSAKQARGVIDQIAAVILLDHALALEQSTGTLAGEPVPELK